MLLLVLFCSLFGYYPSQENTEPQTLTVRVTGLESSEGKVRVAVYNAADKFLEHPCHQQAVKVKRQKAVQTSFSLPKGQYAIAVYHDENENQKLDKNLFGLPTEAYGFSNNARGSMGPPSFEDAQISLQQPNQTVSINLH